MTDPTHPPGQQHAARRDARRTVRPVVLAAAVLVAAPLLWFTHLTVLYGLVPWTCRIDSDLPLHAVTVIALTGLVTCVGLAVRAGALRRAGEVGDRLTDSPPSGPQRPDPTHRTASDRTTSDQATPGQRQGPDTITGFAVAAVFAGYFGFVVAMTGLVPVVVDRCA